MTGRVERILIEKGYFFIQGENGVDYFCHRTALQDGSIHHLNEGDQMEFTPTEGDKGPRAEDARRLES